jgi:hypothetical protein
MQRQSGRSPLAAGPVVSIDDFDDAVGPGIDQDRSAVDHGVAIIANAVFGRHVVIRYPLAREVSADPHIALVDVRGVMPLDDVAVKPGTLIDAQDTVDTADDATHDATNYSADWPRGAFALAGAALNSSGYALGGSDGRKEKQRRCNKRSHGGRLHRYVLYVFGSARQAN